MPALDKYQYKSQFSMLLPKEQWRRDKHFMVNIDKIRNTDMMAKHPSTLNARVVKHFIDKYYPTLKDPNEIITVSEDIKQLKLIINQYINAITNLQTECLKWNIKAFDNNNNARYHTFKFDVLFMYYKEETYSDSNQEIYNV